VQGRSGTLGETLEARVAAHAADEATRLGLVVLGVTVSSPSRAPVAHVVVDLAVPDEGRLAEGANPAAPVDIDTVAALSRGLGAALDDPAVAPDDLTLEVSSPGVERPLVAAADFVRNLGRQVEFDAPPHGTEDADRPRGRVVAVEDGSVVLALRGGGEQRVALGPDVRAVQVLPW
jgi:ribosome maturation factor RimP